VGEGLGERAIQAKEYAMNSTTPAYFLAIDQGTSSSRAIIFDQTAHIIAIGQHDFPQYYPADGWVEHDPEQIWQTTLQSCHDALSKANLPASAITGIGITNQRETTIIWDKNTGQPIYRAIVWQDRRTTADCDALIQQGADKLVHQKTGLVLDPYFSASKIAWVLTHVPNAKLKAQAGELLFGTIETFLLWRLTNGKQHLTDVTNASRTALMNLYTCDWDDELLKLFDIPRQLLPTIVDNHGNFGVTDKTVFDAEIPINAMIGDQQAAAFGQACFKPGMMKSTYGTGCFVLVNTGNQPVYSTHQLLTTVQYCLPQQATVYGLEGSIFIAGAAVQWLRDGLHLIRSSKEIQTLAATVQDNGGVYFIPAFTGLGAPYWNPHARGMITGLTRDTNAGHLAKATLEAVCYQTKDLLSALQLDKVDVNCLRVDGGMAVNNELMQFLADILAVEVHRPAIVETTALGAALLVGLQAGIYTSLSDIEQLWQLEHRFAPTMQAELYQHLYQTWLHWITTLNQAS
jgi:glycerol kinase